MARYDKVPFWNRKFHFYLRMLQTTKNPVWRAYCRLRYKMLQEAHGCFINYNARIGKGLYIGHPYHIGLNLLSSIGDNINIHEGVVLGQANRGAMAGGPTLGNKVFVGLHSVIVGKVTIGDDVLIAPNSYVNCDVPSHSVVFGNPCIIKHRENATEGYINNIV